jgi:Zn-dependent protease/CBS domain-containing protein
MQSGWRVGSLFGIPLYVDPSWLLILVFVVMSQGHWFQRNYQEWGTPTAFGIGGAMALLLFTSVLLHELGHSLVAKSQGIKVTSITLFLFGGVAAIERESKTPGQAFQVAIAGPLVSLGLFGGLAILTMALPGTRDPLNVLARNLAMINLTLAVFNLLPGLPLDGGQVLKSIVWKITGSRFKGVYWAARSGKLLSGGALVAGLTTLTMGSVSGLWLALLGWFGLNNAINYARLTKVQEALLALKASDAMTREYRVVDANMRLHQFADTYVLDSTPSAVYYAASEGRYRGIVAVEELHTIERELWDQQTLLRIVHPLQDIPTAQEGDSLVTVIQTLETDDLRRITVLTPAGAIAGVIDRGDIVQAVVKRIPILMPEGLIQKIKDEGSYPPGFQLGDIARSVQDLSPPPKSKQ